MKSAVVVGSLNLDYSIALQRVPQPGETIAADSLTLNPGGKGANQAYALGRLGCRTAMIGAVGRDGAGDTLIRNLQSAGVDCSGVLRREEPTGQAFITVDKQGENSIIILHGANYTLTPADIEEKRALIEAADCLLHARGLVDLIIPRGGRGLIDFVRQNATVPVIETGAGVCHAYFDCYADLEKGKAIVLNAKTRRVSVCNALDCLIVDAARLADLPALCAPLQDKHVMIYADAASYNALKGVYPDALLQEAGADAYGKEFLDYKMAVKTTGSLADAIDHVSRYGSGHSECIITENKQRAGRFCREIDAACVYVNAPTSFTDGAQFGLGAEIGISTQKLHARGPMGLEEITSYKWLIEGEGQVRE